MREDSEIDGDASAGATAMNDAPASDGAPPRGAPASVSGASVAGTMTITFKLYATLQDLLPAGALKNAVAIEVADDVTLNEVIDRHRVPRKLAHLVLVNGVFVGDADRDERGRLKANDVLAIWPPVAGG